MKRKILPLALVLTLLAGGAQAKELTVQGVGPDQNAALRDAFRNGVEKVVGIMVDATTLVNNNRVVQDEIYARAQGFVRDYKILFTRNNGGQVVLDVWLDINESPGSQLLSTMQRLRLINLMENPRIAVMVRAKDMAGVETTACETAINKALLQAGFRHVIDPKQLERFHRDGSLQGYLDNGDNTIVNSAKTAGYDYLVVGDAFSESAGRVADSMIYSSRAKIDLRIIKVDTAEIIATDNSYAAGVDITGSIAGNKALDKAGAKMGQFVVNRLLANGQSVTQGLQLKLVGLSSYEQLNRIAQAIKGVTGVQGAYIRDYAEGSASIDVDSSQNAMAMYQALQGRVPYSMTLIGKTANTLTIKL